MTGRRLQFVEVVQHEHERNRARPQGRSKTRRSASQHRHAETAHVSDQVGVSRRDLSVGGCQQGQQGRRIIVQAVERDPCDAAILGDGPLTSKVDLP